MRLLTALSGLVATSVLAGVSLMVAPGGSAASVDPRPSVKAPLSASAYAGLACSPFDRRLRGVALPNGVGPEARAAAACWQLEWRTRSGVPAPPIKVHASPDFPAWLVKRITTATATGHRLFGRFADVRTYEVIASVDPQYSCRKGAEIFDPRITPVPQGLRSWSQAWNSGCPGTDYSPGGWTAYLLGETGQEYIAWTLIRPEDRQMLTDKNVLGPTWFMGAASHEFVHSIQIQRALDSPRGMESIGRWFGEGQAQYLGNTAAAYTIGPKDIRSAQLRQLRDVMRQEKVTTVDFEAMGRDFQTPLVWPAGYFAYEWLVAHFGIDATFAWWDAWNTDCEQPGQGTCWREKTPELMGMDADTLIDRLNDYVNAQVKR